MKNGFSLIEISVTLAMIGLFAFFSVCFGSRYSSYHQLNAFSENVVCDLRLAQQEAVSFSSNVKVIFKKKSESAATYSMRRCRIDGGEEITKTMELPLSLDFEDEGEIEFSPSGATPPGKSGTIAIKDKFGREKKITVYSVTGRVRFL